MACKACSISALDSDNLVQRGTKYCCGRCGRVITDTQDHDKTNFQLWLHGRISFLDYVRATMAGE